MRTCVSSSPAACQSVEIRELDLTQLPNILESAPPQRAVSMLFYSPSFRLKPILAAYKNTRARASRKVAASKCIPLLMDECETPRHLLSRFISHSVRVAVLRLQWDRQSRRREQLSTTNWPFARFISSAPRQQQRIQPVRRLAGSSCACSPARATASPQQLRAAARVRPPQSFPSHSAINCSQQ